MPRKTAARTLAFTNPDRVLFPSGFTKAEMIRYYLEAAPYLLPHLMDRPITLIRFPEGVRGESFYEKNAPGFTPDWIRTFKVPRREHEGHINYILVNDAETLAWCANLAAIEFHPFLHRAPELETPTHVAFDLDPGEGADIFTCAEVAFLLREVFDGLGLESFPKVSGSKGVQLYVPLNTAVGYEATQPFAKSIAELLAGRHPKLIVSEMPKALRKGRVMIDWSQNSRSKTTVAAYSLRGKRDEPFVSVPLTWKELERAHARKDRDALYFTPGDTLRRLKKGGDPFAPVLTLQQRLPEAFMNLEPPRRKSASLARYAEKRDFTKTAEPAPELPRRSRQGSARRFVIQKHAASHLHFDFRLEMEGTLKSWAVPKGLPYEKGVRRSAFQVEDHPLDYLSFEGTIPQGQYGGGTVMVWDIGTYEVISGDWRKGDLKLWLNGKKLRGEWHIFRIKSDEEKPVWLVQKGGEPMKPLSARQEDASVLSRRSMAEIARDNDAQWQSNRDPQGAPEAAPAAKRRARQTPPAYPVPQFIEPMAAVPVMELPDGPEWLYEVKWDGFRALGLKHGGEVRLLSRKNKALSKDFPDVASALGDVRAHAALIDGEIVAVGADGRPSFQALQNRASTPAAIQFYAFDLLELDGRKLAAEPLEERRRLLETVIGGTELRFSDELRGSAREVVAAVGKLGLEGVVAKRRGSPYSPGERNPDWKKLRLSNEQEFVIGGYKPGMAPFESVLVGYYEGRKLKFASKVRPGFNPRSRRAVWDRIKNDESKTCPFSDLPDTDKKGRWGEGITAEDMKDFRWVKPRVVIQVSFLEWTDHGHLRHPAFRGVREDKKPREVVRETS